MLVIEWMSGESEGYSDLLPERWFKKDVRAPFMDHEVLGPRGGTSTARCSLIIKGKIADLDYTGDHARYNRKRFALGTMRLVFTNATRTAIAKVEWRNEGIKAVYVDADVEWYNRSMPLVELGTFNPVDVKDGRKQIEQMVTLRQGQQAFRRDLMKAYGARCAITGCAIPDVLEAAHISPYLGEHTNHVSNGLLLRADMHTLFDRGLIKIDREYRISARDAVRAAFGLPAKITLPAEAAHHPSRDALDIKFRET
jgi:hypothetical protein